MAEVADYYTGFTQAEVEAILAVQKVELTKALQAYSESNTSVTKRALDDVNAIIAACQAALRRFDPVTYGKRKSPFVRTGVYGYLEK